MAFPPQFLDEIRDRVPLSDAIGRHVKLVRRGREHTGLCPFHNEKTPSFTVNEDKGFYHCFGCGAHGDVIGFVMRAESLSFPEAVEKLAGEAGLPVPQSSPQERERAKQAQTLHAANEAACQWFEKQLRLPQGKAARDYLKDRGLDEATVARFRLGYAPDGGDRLKTALMGDGLSEGLLLEAGLIGKPADGRATYDRFRGRIVFPITDRRGRAIAFGGRAMGDGTPKYLNSPETPVFHKGRVLYALALAREAVSKTGEVIVTEGYMDVIALHQVGFAGAVAPLGTALTEGQIELLWRLAPEPVLCFDGDEAGHRAAARAAERVLPLLKPGHSLRFAMLPKGEDPDSLVRNQGETAMRTLISGARPLVDLIWQIETAGRPVDTPERRALIRKSVLDRAAQIAERSVQANYIDEFEARLHMAFSGQNRSGGRSAGTRADRFRGRRAGQGAGGGFRQPGAADTGLRADGNVNVLETRLQQALIATILNHPGILSEVGEEFGGLTFGPMPDSAPPGANHGDLDKIRQEIIKTSDSSLDSVALQNHLKELGFSGSLERILSQEVYELAPFARQGVETGDALSGWRHLRDVFARQRTLDREVDQARRALAEEISTRNWEYLNALKQQPWPGAEDAETG